MKKILFLFALLLTVSAQAKDRVIDRPAFKSSNTYSLQPVKVELTKKATIVHFRMSCAHWRDWSMDGARLESGGKTYAFQHGRIITHDGATVLADEAFEIGRKYTENAQQDSLILTFEPLPKEAKTFDYLESDSEGPWKIYGIRLDNQLYPTIFSPYQKPADDGEPLKPLTLRYGEATATLIQHGGGAFDYFGEFSRDPITGQYECKSQHNDSTTAYCHPAYVATRPIIIQEGIDGQFPLILIPGETFTLEADVTACWTLKQDFAAGKRSFHDCYRFGGTLGDLNQVLLENKFLHYRYISGTPTYTTGEDVSAWCDALWQSLDTLRRGVVERRGYTRRQQDFLQLLLEDYYVRTVQEHTLVDAHANDLILFRDGRSYYLPPMAARLPYLEANGLDHGEVYEWLKGFAEAQEIGKKMKAAEVQPDSVILAAHPYFQPVLRAFNDSTRVLVERLRREAKDRMMPTPDVSADQLLSSIVAQHPGKAVFFDFWATWCGPCKQGIKAMEPLKETLQGSDIVFIYLTDESSPLNQWSEQVLKIPGLHYRVPSSLWSHIPGLGAIPQYYLYDRQGKRVWEQTGFGDDSLEEIKREIQKALDSQK